MNNLNAASKVFGASDKPLFFKRLQMTENAVWTGDSKGLANLSHRNPGDATLLLTK